MMNPFGFFVQDNWEELKNHEKVKKYCQLQKEFHPVKSVEYGWVFEYALRKYESSGEALESLENKAENLIKYLTPGSGLLTIGSIVFVDKYAFSWWILSLLCLGIISCLLSLLSAFGALIPGPHPMLAPVDEAIRTAEYFREKEDHAKAQFALSIEWATKINALIADRKGASIHWSYKFLAVGIFLVLFVVPVVQLIIG